MTNIFASFVPLNDKTLDRRRLRNGQFRITTLRSPSGKINKRDKHTIWVTLDNLVRVGPHPDQKGSIL